MARNDTQNQSEKSATREGIVAYVDERQAFCSLVLGVISVKQAIFLKGAHTSFRKWLLFAVLLLMGSTHVYAQPSNATCVAQGFLDRLNDAVFFPLIILLSGIALLMFLYGGFRFVLGADSPTARDNGKRHMIYGIIGLLVMVSAATILAIAANSFGVSSTPGAAC